MAIERRIKRVIDNKYKVMIFGDWSQECNARCSKCFEIIVEDAIGTPDITNCLHCNVPLTWVDPIKLTVDSFVTVEVE